MMRFVVILISFLFSLVSFAQKIDSTQLFIYADPSGDYRIKINNELQKEGHSFKVVPGKHNISVWAPNYFQKDTVLTVGNKEITTKLTLEKTPELKKYLSLTFKHKRQANKILFYGIGAMGTGSAATIAILNNGKLHLNKIRNEFGAEHGIGGYSRSKFNAARNALLANNILIYTGTTLCVGSIFYMVKNIQKKKALETPSLNKDDSFLVDDIGFHFDKNYGYSFNLKLRF